MKDWLHGLLLLAAGAAFFWALCRYLPGLAVRKVHDLFVLIRGSAWMRAKPHRARLLLALIQLLEEEIPEPGTGREFYAGLGEAIAKLPATASSRAPVLLKAPLLALGVMLTGSGPKWADVLEKVGDAVDTELDEEIKSLASADATDGGDAAA